MMKQHKTKIMKKKELKKRIEELEAKVFGGVKNEKPVAGWYTYVGYSEYLMFRSEEFIYGFGSDGEFVDERPNTHEVVIDGNYHLADPKEVEKRLIEEAVKRGFKEGVRVGGWINMERMTDRPLTGRFNTLITKHNHHLKFGDYSVFRSGEWATIIEEHLMLNGKEVTYNRSTSSIHVFGCTYDYDSFDKIVSDLEMFDEIDAITANGEIYEVGHLRNLITQIEKQA